MPIAASIKVLIVDDQPPMRHLVRSGLQQLGFRAFTEAGDGEAGLRALIMHPAHLVISDYVMPRMDGLAFLRSIRAYDATAKTAYIMLTGRSDRELVQKAVHHGVSTLMVKPFTLETLRDRIESVFGLLS